MKLYIFRHAPAMERPEFAQTGKTDDLRPLTEKGEERMEDVLQVFKKNEDQVDLILHSPFVRCKQTAKIIKKFYPDAKVCSSDHLKPDFLAQKMFEEIKKIKVDSLVLVGHEPDLGQFISWLLFRQATDHFPLKKAGVAKIDLYEDGRCYLKWLLRPKLMIK